MQNDIVAPANQPQQQPVQPAAVQQPSFQPAAQQAGPSMVDMQQASDIVKQVSQTYQQFIVGQTDLLESIMVTLIAKGHLLIEGVPGLAKTTAAHTIAASIGADFVRVQCTPDMLPSDIVGTQIYNQDTHEFTTQLGPINHQFVLVDEINRTGAKTQSALLEAMQERQVSIGGQTHQLPPGFIVMATQNPIEQEGTYPLPEAQLDRFVLKHVISYPTVDEEVSILKVKPRSEDISAITTNTTVDDLLHLQQTSNAIAADDRILKYIATLVAATRNPDQFGLADLKPFIEVGASPRASLALLAAGRACALMSQSSYVTPDHIKPYLTRALRHRLVLTYEAEAENTTVEQIIERIGSAVQVP
jgi:MoxR-like ATPase